MSLSSLAIAVQGVGFAPLLVAVQGFYDTGSTPPPVTPPYTPPMSGGASWALRSPRSERAETPQAEARDFSQQNKAIINVVVIAVTSGMLE